MTKANFDVGSSVAQAGWTVLTQQYWASFDDGLDGEGINFYDPKLFYAPVIAINVWESILDEVFRNDIMLYEESIFGEKESGLERLSVVTKTKIYPRILTNKTILKKDDDLWSDFKNICTLRNEIVHFKSSLYEAPNSLLKAVKSLRDKKITVHSENSSTGWIYEISTSEVSRFCINTLYQMINKLFEILEETNNQDLAPIYRVRGLFKEITIEDAKKKMLSKGISVDRVKNMYLFPNE